MAGEANSEQGYFGHDADIGVIGGALLAAALERVAAATFAIMADLDYALVTLATEQAGLAKRVAFLRTVVCIKG